MEGQSSLILSQSTTSARVLPYRLGPGTT